MKRERGEVEYKMSDPDNSSSVHPINDKLGGGWDLSSNTQYSGEFKHLLNLVEQILEIYK